MTKEKEKELEQILSDHGYQRYNSCLTSTEDFAYFKPFDITEDEYGDKIVGYQIAFRFWDWGKYGQSGNEEFGVDIIVLTSGVSRWADLKLSIDNYDIERIEMVGEDFYEFAKTHALISNDDNEKD